MTPPSDDIFNDFVPDGNNFSAERAVEIRKDTSFPDNRNPGPALPRKRLRFHEYGDNNLNPNKHPGSLSDTPL
jgi:hypothetical protein